MEYSQPSAQCEQNPYLGNCATKMEAIMANPEHLALLLKSAAEKNGMKRWNKWTQRNPNVTIDLSKARLGGRVLVNANLVGVNLEGADLQYANLKNANIKVMRVGGANFYGTDLHGIKNYSLAQFSQAKNLYGAINIPGGLGALALRGLERAEAEERDKQNPS